MSFHKVFKLQFIYSSYSEPIGLDEIAGAAGISPRECSRCFHRAIDRPPIRFLIEYRAQMAAIKLERTDDSISSIAEQCGFDACPDRAYCRGDVSREDAEAFSARAKTGRPSFTSVIPSPEK